MLKQIRTATQPSLLSVLTTPTGTLYLGTLQQAATLTLLKDSRVSAVVSVGSNIPLFYQEKWGIHHKIFAYEESDTYTTTARLFEMASQQIHTYLSHGNVLVHCTQTSLSYSASVVIAYLMLYDSMAYEKAFYHLKSVKSSINPSVLLKRYLSTFALSNINAIKRLGAEERRSESPPSSFYCRPNQQSNTAPPKRTEEVVVTLPADVEFSFQYHEEPEEQSTPPPPSFRQMTLEAPRFVVPEPKQIRTTVKVAPADQRDHNKPSLRQRVEVASKPNFNNLLNNIKLAKENRATAPVPSREPTERKTHAHRQSMECTKRTELWRDPEFQINKSLSTSKFDIQQSISTTAYRWRQPLLTAQKTETKRVEPKHYHSEQKTKRLNAASTLYKSFYYC